MFAGNSRKNDPKGGAKNLLVLTDLYNWTTVKHILSFHVSAKV